MGINELLRPMHKPVLAQNISKLWQCYFHPEDDEKPLSKYPRDYPAIRADLAQDGSLLLVDATLGEAGHAKLLLTQQKRCRLLGIDADPQMRERARQFLEQDFGKSPSIPATESCRWQLIARRFGDYFAELEANSLNADLILFDLGVSLFHYDSARGFSFRPQHPDEELDMRLDPDSGPSAANLLQTLGETELADIFWQYGELHRSRKVARCIVGQRNFLELHKAQVLADFLCQIIPSGDRPKRGGRQAHPATQVFQALRIAVNDELGQLKRSMPPALAQLRPYGLLAIITFHSLEDRLVKQQFRAWQDQGLAQWVYKKAIQAPYDSPLPSERSAKLRIVRRMY